MNMDRGTVRRDKQAQADGEVKTRGCAGQTESAATEGEDESISERVNWACPVWPFNREPGSALPHCISLIIAIMGVAGR